MVCNRCIRVVKQELDNLKFFTGHINLGEIELLKSPVAKQLKQLDDRLRGLGFELLDDEKQKLIEKIKNVLIKKVQSEEIEEGFSLSKYLTGSLNKDYSHISRLFSDVEGTTIEHFFILQKIEKVKEWLVYKELTINEISWKLGYSSPAHLSAQFKQITGLTPTQLKKTAASKRKSLDLVNHK